MWVDFVVAIMDRLSRTIHGVTSRKLWGWVVSERNRRVIPYLREMKKNS